MFASLIQHGLLRGLVSGLGCGTLDLEYKAGSGLSAFGRAGTAAPSLASRGLGRPFACAVTIDERLLTPAYAKIDVLTTGFVGLACCRTHRFLQLVHTLNIPRCAHTVSTVLPSPNRTVLPSPNRPPF